MITIQTTTATPTQLDWLVATCEGRDPLQPPSLLQLHAAGYTVLVGSPRGVVPDQHIPQYTSWWSLMGPIIAKYQMDMKWVGVRNVRASLDWLDEEQYEGFGPTPLIAAARCLVLAKLGQDVQIPDRLA